MSVQDIRQGRVENGQNTVRELRRISMMNGALSYHDAHILRVAADMLEGKPVTADPTTAELIQECARRGERIRELKRKLALYIGAEEDETAASGLLEE